MAAFSGCCHRDSCIIKLVGMVATMLYFTNLIAIFRKLNRQTTAAGLDQLAFGPNPAAIKNFASNDDGVDKVDSEGESFSACILIMDENHRLSEWIGYHYFAMSLRYLVVAVDPHSKTSPSQILNRWRDRMTIVEWTDSNFTDKFLINLNTDGHIKKTKKHRARQADFYLECTRHLQSHNRTWTSYHAMRKSSSVNPEAFFASSRGT
ncbi:hypothetical protein ACHAXA_009132 [Cyclostephanos tholiformis]|uniref:Uncharacterized protein n=1 Tax=Cyclostephanos tholiformis TaxID=382380 RepID=A0ABD3RWW9_9STRA